MVTDVGVLPDLCQPFMTALPISGVSITIVSNAGSQSTLCSSDETAARIDELQFELGEGPQATAIRSGEVVVISDVPLSAHDQWPVLGGALMQLPVGAIFTVPMKMGAVVVGVATLYCTRVGTLSAEQLITASAIASAIASAAVQHAFWSTTDDAPPETAASPALRREIHQATGMVLVQLNTTATVAYSRLQAYAFANGRTLQSVAHDVVARKLTFEDETP